MINGDQPKFTLVKQEADKTWSSLVKMEDIPVLVSKVEKSEDWSKFALSGLSPTVQYDMKTTYTKDNIDKPYDSEIKGPDVLWGKVDHGIVADNWTPKEIRVKPKKGGLRQTLWQEKKVS
jgi:hypothetical protein